MSTKIDGNDLYLANVGQVYSVMINTAAAFFADLAVVPYAEDDGAGHVTYGVDIFDSYGYQQYADITAAEFNAYSNSDGEFIHITGQFQPNDPILQFAI